MATYFAFAVSITLLIASPGPVMTLVIADAAHVWPVWSILGGAVSAQLLLGSAMLAIYLALDIDPLILEWGRLLGGLYLAWLGIAALRSGEVAAIASNQNRGYYFLRALKVGLSNPKDIMFFLAFLPGFIIPTRSFSEQAVSLALIWAAIDISIMVIYATLAKQLLRHDGCRRLLHYMPGVFLLAIGLLSSYLGLRSLHGL